MSNSIDSSPYDSLSLAERAEMIKEGVRGGLRSVEEIKKYYNDISSKNNKFRRGGKVGSLRPIPVRDTIWERDIKRARELMKYGKDSPLNFINKTKRILLDRNLPSIEDYYLRQTHAENRFKSTGESEKGAVGLNQIMSSALQDYNKENKIKYTMQDMKRDIPNNNVRLFTMNSLLNADWNNKEQATANKLLKAAVGYNWGRGNTVRALNRAKKEEHDIYNDTTWLRYVPKESSDYAKFIVFGDSTGVSRNLPSFFETMDKNKSKVKMIKESLIPKLKPSLPKNNTPIKEVNIDKK